MSYQRVIPRDLFNEAKLLKCLGQLSLIIHEGKGIRWPLSMEHVDSEDGFIVDQDPDTGGIFVVNMSLFVGENHVGLYSPLNSRRPYPLQFEHHDESGDVFDDAGNLSPEFVSWLDSNVNAVA